MQLELGPAGWIDAQDVGSQRAEHSRADRPRDDARKVKHAQPPRRARGSAGNRRGRDQGTAVAGECMPLRLGPRVTAVAPPGRLDGNPLRWPGLPTRYGADAPTWR